MEEELWIGVKLLFLRHVRKQKGQLSFSRGLGITVELCHENQGRQLTLWGMMYYMLKTKGEGAAWCDVA